MSSGDLAAELSSAAVAVVRRVKGADYAAIMAIGDVYQLAEYLPHMFYQFLEDESYSMYVIEVDGKIVSANTFVWQTHISCFKIMMLIRPFFSY